MKKDKAEKLAHLVNMQTDAFAEVKDLGDGASSRWRLVGVDGHGGKTVVVRDGERRPVFLH